MVNSTVSKGATEGISLCRGEIRNGYVCSSSIYLVGQSSNWCTWDGSSGAVINYSNTYDFSMSINGVSTLISRNSNRIRTNFRNICSWNWELKTSCYIWKSEDSWIYCASIIMIDCIVVERSTYSISHCWRKIRDDYINSCWVYLISLSSYSCTWYCCSRTIINNWDTNDFIVSIGSIWTLITWNSYRIRANFWNVRSRYW